MNLFVTVLAIIAGLIISIIILKKPLEDRDIEGARSLFIRILIGLIAGIIIGFLISI